MIIIIITTITTIIIIIELLAVGRPPEEFRKPPGEFRKPGSFDAFPRDVCGGFAENYGVCHFPLQNDQQKLLWRLAETTNPHENLAEKRSVGLGGLHVGGEEGVAGAHVVPQPGEQPPHVLQDRSMSRVRAFLSIYLSIYLSISLSLSLPLYIYIYIYTSISLSLRRAFSQGSCAKHYLCASASMSALHSHFIRESTSQVVNLMCNSPQSPLLRNPSLITCQ